MRAIALLAVFLAANPALAAEVRVKSKHDKAIVSGVSGECLKVGGEETLRAGVIGPASVRVSLRRLGDAKLPPIQVKLMKDGREVARLMVGGKLKDTVEGEDTLASAPLDKAVDIPAGPHTLFVEVGPGMGAVLVSFNEQRIAKQPEAIAKAEPVKTEPRKAEQKKVEPAKPETALAKAEPKKTERVPAKGSKLGDDTEQPAKPTQPVKVSKLDEEDELAPLVPQTAKPSGSRLEDADETMVAQKAPITAPSADRVRWLLGPRLGVADQTQLGAAGPAVGLSVRWAVVGASTRSGTRGLLVGLSADMLRYSFNFKVPATRPLGAFEDQVTVTSVPILLEGTWSFGNPESARLTPYLGIAAGIAAGSISTQPTEGVATAESTAFTRLALGAHLGLEFPMGGNRLGLEARWLWSQVGDSGPVQDLEVGGLLLQASWRFGL
ncbi:MAG: hypothetical protein HY901_25670 [Deltaproteobacteria bacterium]|nr:hypothetical protein [Deltaproteobacteria bacterium]